MHSSAIGGLGQSGGGLLQADNALAFTRTIDHDAEFDLGALA